MSTVLTIRNVPDDVKDALAKEAQERGQSLQAFLLGVLRQQAQFSRNRELLAKIESDLGGGGGAGSDAPDAWQVIEQARRERENGNGSAA